MTCPLGTETRQSSSATDPRFSGRFSEAGTLGEGVGVLCICPSVRQKDALTANLFKETIILI